MPEVFPENFQNLDMRHFLKFQCQANMDHITWITMTHFGLGFIKKRLLNLDSFLKKLCLCKAVLYNIFYSNARVTAKSTTIVLCNCKYLCLNSVMVANNLEQRSGLCDSLNGLSDPCLNSEGGILKE